MAKVANDLPAIGDGLPNVCGGVSIIAAAISSAIDRPAPSGEGTVDWSRVRSAFAIALHMHQPLIPAGGPDPRSAGLISNLRQMMQSTSDEQRNNAGIFRWCYQRMGEFIPQLIQEGKQPRVMLDYSGTLLWGLQQMGLDEVLGNLRTITCEPRYRDCVEWLGSAWGHPVAPSTPVQDYRLHVRAWRQHFAALFGLDALTRVRGFSPAEMALPNQPDVAYEFVRTLKECGYRWVLVQEHTVECPDTGAIPDRKHLPHRLMCRNSQGETAEIIAIIKTQGSDTKTNYVAEMKTKTYATASNISARHEHLRSWFPEIAPLNIGHFIRSEPLVYTQRASRFDLLGTAANGRGRRHNGHPRRSS